MRTRLFSSMIVVVMIALPVAAQAPALTFQIEPGGKLLQDIRAMAKAVGGEEAVKQFDAELKKNLGEKGFTGVDLTRPIVGYTELTEKAEASGAIVVAPITSQDEFLDFLKRTKVTADKVAGAEGLYKLTPPKASKDQKPAKLRFKDRHAYIGINVPDASLAAEKLIPTDKLTLPGQNVPFAYRVHLDRIPQGLKKQAFTSLDKLVTQAKALPASSPPEIAIQQAAEPLAKMVKRLGDQVLTEGRIAAFRVLFEQPTGKLGFELALTPKPGTPLAKEIAGRKPTTNRFAGLITKDAAAGSLFQLPLFAPEIRNAVVVGLEQAQKSATVPPPYQPIVDEAFKGGIRTFKSGEFDLGVALLGPDKDGLFNASLGISFDDPSGLEKALRAALKKADPGVKGLIQMDAAKVNGVNVHRVAAGPFLPPEVQKVFGESAALYVAFAPKGIYLTFGQAGQDVMAAALKTKPTPSKAFDIVLNPKRLHKLFGIVNPKRGAEGFAQMFGTEDKQISAMSASVEGGSELRLRFSLNLKLLPRAAVGSATVQPVPGAAPAQR